MIVRINQLDVSRTEPAAEWWPQGPTGPLAINWPSDAKAYEVLILQQDEQSRPLSLHFRQAQMRQLIPQTIAALREPGEEVVLRLDGPLAQGELLPAFNYLTDESGYGRFAISEVQKLVSEPLEAAGSVRVQWSGREAAGLLADTSLGLERSVRLRVFCVPAEFVNPLLATSATDDERWAEILPLAGFVLGTVRGLRALHLISRRFESATLKTRLMQQLTAAAQSAGAV